MLYRQSRVAQFLDVTWNPFFLSPRVINRTASDEKTVRFQTEVAAGASISVTVTVVPLAAGQVLTFRARDDLSGRADEAALRVLGRS